MIDTEDTVYTFDQLSERAKGRARDEYRESDYPDYEWWDSVYEDAVRMGALIGIEIDQTKRKNSRGFEICDIGINFSGFSCQGDGASFHGEYDYKPDAIEKIKAECDDEELLRIASELTVLQLTRRLNGLEFFSASISTSGRDTHSGAMKVNVNSEDEDDEHNEVGDDLEDTATQLMRDYADLIYKWLEEEHDYLTSDECIDQYLADEKFDEFGSVI